MDQEKKNSALEYGREILLEESRALAQVASLIGESFYQAIQLILEHPKDGRIIISGMGKAGYVGQKISATLSSLGFPSFFIHPGDAVHGDLGRCTERDIVIILSKSGETPEVVTLLPLLKKIGAKIISITAKAESTLGTYSDTTLCLGEIQDAGPLGLAPTTSTTAMLALGDALAMTLVKVRGFTREEFALFHPGGELGRSLLKVEEIMRQGDMFCVVPQSMKTRDVMHQIGQTKGRPGAVAVIDEAGLLAGIFTDGDLRRAIDKGEGFLDLPISESATKSPKFVQVGQLAQEAARVIRDHRIDDVLVVNSERKPVGLIDIQDLLARGIK